MYIWVARHHLPCVGRKQETIDVAQHHRGGNVRERVAKYSLEYSATPAIHCQEADIGRGTSQYTLRRFHLVAG